MTYLGPAGIFSTGDAAADQSQIECEQAGQEDGSGDDQVFVQAKCLVCGYHDQDEYRRGDLSATRESLEEDHKKESPSCPFALTFEW